MKNRQEQVEKSLRLSNGDDDDDGMMVVEASRNELLADMMQLWGMECHQGTGWRCTN